MGTVKKRQKKKRRKATRSREPGWAGESRTRRGGGASPREGVAVGFGRGLLFAPGWGNASPGMMADEPIVCIRDLSKVYEQGEIQVTALDRVSLDIAAGEFLTLMGPSGSGKSTLLHIIAGIDRPTGGSCHVQGIDVAQLNETELAAWRNHNVGFVFQTFNLIPVLTAFENVELPLLLTRLNSRERRRQVDVALELVGLADRRRHLPRQLSGGQEQRVAIARALVTDPSLVVADEPTGNLDSHSAQEVLEILQALSRTAGKTVLLVTHDPKAAAYGSRSIHLEKGVLVG